MTKDNQNNIIVRYPPSPTGDLHIGNIRTLLFNYLYAKHNSGEIYMRFEDTDKERSSVEYENVALEALEALGLSFDHGPYRQSERGELYTEAISRLIKQDNAYVGEESKDGSGDKIIRFKNPNKKITFTDKIRGEITIDTTDFGDFVIARSLNSPLYHLTVVVDDIEMGITDIIRGEDHITSTPRQILLIDALGGTVPNYAHLPLIIGSDKKKLSKRHGAITYQAFRDSGYLPEAIINYLALLGWSDGDDREFYTLEELVMAFSLAKVHKSPAMFSYQKLDSINRHYVLKLTNDTFEKEVYSRLPKEIVSNILTKNKNIQSIILHTIIKERINKWGDLQDISDNELVWILNIDNINIEKIVWKKSTKEETKKHLISIQEILKLIPESVWSEGDKDNIKEAIWEYVESNGRGDVLWPMRYGLTGSEKSTDPFTVAIILGKKEVLSRLNSIIIRL